MTELDQLILALQAAKKAGVVQVNYVNDRIKVSSSEHGEAPVFGKVATKILQEAGWKQTPEVDDERDAYWTENWWYYGELTD